MLGKREEMRGFITCVHIFILRILKHILKMFALYQLSVRKKLPGTCLGCVFAGLLIQCNCHVTLDLIRFPEFLVEEIVLTL